MNDLENTPHGFENSKVARFGQLDEIKSSPTSVKILVSASRFKVVSGQTGPLLQFSFTFAISHPGMGEIGMTVDHCLAYIDSLGELRWHPPANYFGGFKGGKKQLHVLTTPLYNMIKNAILKSRFYNYIADPDKLNEMEVTDKTPKGKFQAFAPNELDDSLPASVDALEAING